MEFSSDGETEFITVQSSDHPQAETDEDYFDDKAVADKIIAED